MEFREKVILITGATGGIGTEIIRKLINEKCKLALFARRENKLKEIAKEIEDKKIECIYKKCDITIKDDVKKAVEFTYERYKKIDIAILSTGILLPNPIESFNSDVIKKSIDINFIGNCYFLEYLLPIMKNQNSSTIAAISTLPDKRGVGGWGAYGASKAAFSLLIESLRVEAKQKYNINIILIKPGFVKTSMPGKYFEQENPRAIEPEEAAEIILKGIKKEKKVIEFPIIEVIGSKTRDMLPVWIYDKIPLHFYRGDYDFDEEK